MSKRENIFFIVGAQRSGTTYLSHILDEHPEICMAKPLSPEPKYFLNKNIDNLNKKEYFNNYFSKCTKLTKIYGEKSTSYYEYENSVRLISLIFPNAKIIFCLRNPIDRALSNFFFSTNNGFEKRTLKEVFLDPNNNLMKKPKNISVNPFNYLGRGEYSKYITTYKKYFCNKQIKILIFEELVNNLVEIQNLYNFLQVDDMYIPKRDIVVNQSEKELEVSTEIINALSIHYKDKNKDLEKILNRNLALWK